MRNLKGFRDRLNESLWFVPAVCMVCAAVAAVILVRLDKLGDESGLIGFTGGPDSARSILSTIGSSVLVLTGLVFSITVLALQLTSSQFSPRALRTFLRDRPTQLSLGVFLATFLFVLLTLREVRGQDGGGGAFVPGISVTVAFGLAVASLATFVHQIHHVAQSIRVVSIIGRISKETKETIDKLFPEGRPAPGDDTPPDGRAAWEGRPVDGRAAAPPPPAGGGLVLPAPTAGVVAFVPIDDLVRRACRHDVVVEVLPAIGEFVPEGGSLVRIHGDIDDDGDGFAKAVVLRPERAMRQDPAYGIRQLVDIAERALSPGINDPSSAVQCLDHIHDLLRRVGTRTWPESIRCDEDGRRRVIVRWPTWDEVVHLAFDEIRHWGAGSLQVNQRLSAVLDDLLAVVPEHRRPPLFRQRQLLIARQQQDLPPEEWRQAGTVTSPAQHGQRP